MDLETATDAALLAASRQDPEAFGLLYQRHVKSLYSWFVPRVDSPQTAFELTAETFAQALKSRNRFKAPPDGSAGPWLAGIAGNLHRMWSRTNRAESSARRRLGVQVDPVPSDEEETDERILMEALRPVLAEALASLPPDQREAVNLRIIEGLSYHEVAARLECSPDGARMRVGRALRAMRASMEGVSR